MWKYHSKKNKDKSDQDIHNEVNTMKAIRKLVDVITDK
jgi:hypothetical protein